jgi:uncharacterized protein (DUF342 family)
MIRLDVTDEFAKLTLSPGDVDASTLTVDYLVNYLSESGVCRGIQNDAMTQVVRLISELECPVKGVVVARQIEPQTGQAAPIIHCLRSGDIAAVGDTIAKLGEVVAAVDGETVRGALIKASAAAETVLSAGAKTEVVGQTMLKARAYGKVASSGKEIHIEPLIHVQEDELTAFIDIHPRSSTGTPITFAMVQGSLADVGIHHGVDNEKIRAAIEQAAEAGTPLLRVAVAEGTPGSPGRDASVAYVVETEQAIGGRRDDGSIDFRERSSIHNVKSGIKICHRIPPTKGEPQVDVYGRVAPARPGRDVVFRAGENVEQREEEFWSTMDGSVMVRDNTVAVSDVYSVPGDIDFETGNLRHEKGAIHIGGTVRSGFKISAASHILVDRTVEDAILTSEGDVEIKGGVLHALSGSIYAEGNVTAKFAQNARITAGANIVITNSSINCTLRAGSQLIVVGGNARLVGGTAHASEGVRVQQLGAEAEVPTRVIIGSNRQAVRAILLKIRRRREEIAAGKATETDLEELLETLRALTDRRANPAAIIVEGIVYPGVTVKIHKRDYKFIEERRSCRIELNQQGKIEVNPLK